MARLLWTVRPDATFEGRRIQIDFRLLPRPLIVVNLARQRSKFEQNRRRRADDKIEPDQMIEHRTDGLSLSASQSRYAKREHRRRPD